MIGPELRRDMNFIPLFQPRISLFPLGPFRSGVNYLSLHLKRRSTSKTYKDSFTLCYRELVEIRIPCIGKDV